MLMKPPQQEKESKISKNVLDFLLKKSKPLRKSLFSKENVDEAARGEHSEQGQLDEYRGHCRRGHNGRTGDETDRGPGKMDVKLAGWSAGISQYELMITFL